MSETQVKGYNKPTRLAIAAGSIGATLGLGILITDRINPDRETSFKAAVTCPPGANALQTVIEKPEAGGYGDDARTVGVQLACMDGNEHHDPTDIKIVRGETNDVTVTNETAPKAGNTFDVTIKTEISDTVIGDVSDFISGSEPTTINPTNKDRELEITFPTKDGGRVTAVTIEKEN